METRITVDELARRMFFLDRSDGVWEFNDKFDSIEQESRAEYTQCATNIIQNAETQGLPPSILEYIEQRDTEHNPYRSKE